VLLRAHLHLRTVVCVPNFLWVPKSEQTVTSDAAPPGAALALPLLLARRRGVFLAFVRRYAHVSLADAEDLLQQALLRATESAGSVRDATHVEAWFYRVLRNTVADARAARSRQGKRLAELSRELVQPPETESSVCACSLALLGHVRPEYADIVRRVDLDEGSVQQVASELHISPGNAKVRLHRARAALRQELATYCGTQSLRACQSCRCEGGPSGAPAVRCGA
jgi:RNA polymerase sigma factor (sigma-70 family)